MNNTYRCCVCFKFRDTVPVLWNKKWVINGEDIVIIKLCHDCKLSPHGVISYEPEYVRLFEIINE
jgi:hypothetical protein